MHRLPEVQLVLGFPGKRSPEMGYDRELNLARIVGGEGSGPGEFRFPTRLARWGDTIVVLDVNLRRVSRFSLEGDLHIDGSSVGEFQDVPSIPVRRFQHVLNARLMKEGRDRQRYGPEPVFVCWRS